jgi:hypothetical protein
VRGFKKKEKKKERKPLIWWVEVFAIPQISGCLYPKRYHVRFINLRGNQTGPLDKLCRQPIQAIWGTALFRLLSTSIPFMIISSMITCTLSKLNRMSSSDCRYRSFQSLEPILLCNHYKQILFLPPCLLALPNILQWTNGLSVHLVFSVTASGKWLTHTILYDLQHSKWILYSVRKICQKLPPFGQAFLQGWVLYLICKA